MVFWLSLFAFLVGLILLYRGVRQAGSILLPVEGHEFLGSTGGDMVYFEKPGNYRMRIENPEVFKKADILLVKSYIGNLRIAVMILMLVAGAFLSISGIIFRMDSLRGRV